ncbi:PAS domain S-box protein [Trinickia sp. EG282A]|uniref:PAS domain S-box protein n=1 Tax=Trinickia sp. EG282A TaxID=3237013 RepID=UPI0034D28D0B
MSGTYNPLLVFVSFVVAFLASYTAIELSSRISLLPQARGRTSWLVGGAIAMGIGIWSMHFIGMLAFALPIPVGYDLSTTAASLLIAVLASLVALITVTRGTLSRARLGAAGTLMGLGIAGMHYTGMSAMEMSPPIHYTFSILMASVAIAIAASIAALWIAFTLRTPEQQNLTFKRLGSAMIMGLAITGMHYTGMDAANFQAGSICLAANKLDANWLALLVSTSSFTVLIGTLVFLGLNTSNLSRSLTRANDELRQRGAELQESEKRFRATFEQAAVGIAHVGPDGRWLRVNQKLCDIVGYTREELLTMTFQDITHPDDLDADLAHLHQMLDGQIDTYTMEKRYFKKDGSEVWIALTVALMRDDANSPDYFISVVADITERKRAEERFRLVVEAAPNAMIMVNRDGRIVLVNLQTEKVFGYPRDELVGQRIDVLVPERLRHGHSDYRAAFFGDPKSRLMGAGRHLYGRRRDGTEVPVEIGLNPIEMAEGMFVLAAIVDITERRRAEEALRQRTEELGRSNRDLEQFAYVASHDLQEPLRAIAGPLQLLRRRFQGQLDARADEYIGHAVDGAGRMQALIDDLLAFSRVGRSEESWQRIDCARELDKALRNLSVAIEESGAQITHQELPTVRALSGQLTLLFQNLVGNAIKFRSKERPVQIHVGAETRDETWLFRVADNGIGIDPQHFERIFLIFQRLHTRRDYPGTGIGLALCKRIVEHHGGRMWVESEPGAGTTFFFTLRRTASDDHQ